MRGVRGVRVRVRVRVCVCAGAGGCAYVCMRVCACTQPTG